MFFSSLELNTISSCYIKYSTLIETHTINISQIIYFLESKKIKWFLKIHGDYDKWLGAYKITHILEHDYGIKINFGRVYRLIQKLNLPTMFTSKPVIPIKSFPIAVNYINHLTSNYHKNTHNKE